MTEAAPLTAKVTVAAGWNTALAVAARAAGAARLAVLAHLLPPAAFGVFAVAILAIDTLEAITTSGFESALTRHRGDIQEYLDTAWTVQALRGGVIGLLLLLLAEPIALFFREPKAALILQLLSIAPVLRGLENIGMVILRRELAFRQRFLWSLGEIVTDFAVAGTAAYVWRTPFALVAGFLAGRFTRTVLSYAVSSFRPKLAFDASKARELHSFGRWILLNNVLFLVALRGDRVVVGRLLGSVALGVYDIAARACEVLIRSISDVTGEVLLPAYARVQDDLPRLRRAFLTTFEHLAAIVIPVTVVLALFAPVVVKGLFGERWLAAATILPLLAGQAAVRALTAIAGHLFIAIGRPSVNFTMNAARVAILSAIVIPLTVKWGLAGTAFAVLASSVGIVPFFMYYLSKDLGVPGSSVLRAIFPGSALGIVAASPVILRGFDEDAFVASGLWLLCSVVLYGVAAFALAAFANKGPVILLRSLLMRTKVPSQSG
jgi:lipopolysaccharide exporter